MNNFVFRTLYGHYLYFLVPLLLIILFIKYKRKQEVMYRYSSIDLLRPLVQFSYPFHKLFLLFLRIGTLILLAYLLIRPQLVDQQSQISIEGIDIVLVLDVSGSMQFRDYDDDKRSRFEVAKEEAIRFVSLRENDAVGLVIFGNDALSRCPITFDKGMVKKLIWQLQIGMVDPSGTVLSRAIIAACNRLKSSVASTKIMILLTDGEPSENDLQPDVAIKIAQELGIKIYTIGIGSDQEGFFMNPLYGIQQKPKVNTQLLEMVAQKTGGSFFLARSSEDMRAVYNTIDTLERTKHEVPFFSRFIELINPFGFIALALLILEILLSSWIWMWL
jgi:Ca-activated chloride channel family protein